MADSPTLLDRLLRINDLLRPVLLVTWAVPADRVRLLVPAALELDTVPGADGAPLALLTVAAVLNVRAHWWLLPPVHFSAAQANYRTYVRGPEADAPPGIYFFANFVSARPARLLTRMVSPNMYYAPARLTSRVPTMRDPWQQWRVRFTMGGPLGPTVLDAGGPCTPAPNLTFAPDAPVPNFFITHRMRGYFTRRGGGLGYVPVDHAELTPWGGRVRAAQCGPWERWGLLDAAAVARPLSVLVQAASPFRAYLPRLR